MIETLIDWMIMLPVLVVILAILFGFWKGISWLGGRRLQELREDHPFLFPVLMLLAVVFTPFLLVAVITGEWEASMDYAGITFCGMVPLLLLLKRASQGF